MTDANEMIERVARAVKRSAFKGMGVHLTEEYAHEIARAAIAAMREPTDAMVNASGCECGTSNACEYTRDEYVANDYRAMIDAALEEPEDD